MKSPLRSAGSIAGPTGVIGEFSGTVGFGVEISVSMVDLASVAAVLKADLLMRKAEMFRLNFDVEAAADMRVERVDKPRVTGALLQILRKALCMGNRIYARRGGGWVLLNKWDEYPRVSEDYIRTFW